METRPRLRLSSSRLGELGELGIELRTTRHKPSGLYIHYNTATIYGYGPLEMVLHLHLKVEYRLSTLCTQLFSEHINKPKQLNICIFLSLKLIYYATLYFIKHIYKGIPWHPAVIRPTPPILIQFVCPSVCQSIHSPFHQPWILNNLI